MNDPLDEDFEPLLRDYLSSQLDGQLGKAAAHFAELPASAPPSTEPRRPTPRRGRLIAAVAVVAASLLAAVWFGFRIGIQPQADRLGAAGGAPGTAPVDPPPKLPDRSTDADKRPSDSLAAAHPSPPSGEPLLVGQQFQWRTIDEGIVYLDPYTPVRKLRRQRLERVQWYDVARGARVEMIVPREEVQFVALPSS